jgi:hypothetical protein
MGHAAPTRRVDAAALVLLGFFIGLVVGVVLGTAARRPPHVVCSSTLRIEPAGPGAWTLVCEGGR